MIYTTYISNIKNLPKDGYILLVTRYNKVKETKNVHWEINLSPSKKLLSDYKNNNETINGYTERYLKELSSNKLAKDSIKNILNMDKKGIKIFLACYEKDYKMCHRTLLGRLLKTLGANFLGEYVL